MIENDGSSKIIMVLPKHWQEDGSEDQVQTTTTGEKKNKEDSKSNIKINKHNKVQMSAQELFDKSNKRFTLDSKSYASQSGEAPVSKVGIN